MEHAWCQDVSRDAAVRAAEDGRDRPLPTLKEAIAAVTEKMSENGIGEEMQQGVRKDRVTLEITYIDGCGHPATWPWGDWIDRPRSGESVRVVADEEREAEVAALRAMYWDRDAAVAKAKDERDAAIRERDAAKARVAELEAASGGGQGEPVAWMCEWTDYVSLHETKSTAEREANGDVVPQPLYRAPPQPRGWLTEVGRE